MAPTHGKDVYADQHVVNMSDDEIGISQLPVDRHRRGHEARNPADDEKDDHAGEDTGTLSCSTGRPTQIVADPRENGHRAWNRNDDGRGAEEGQRQAGQAGREHVMDPDAESEIIVADGGERHRRVADQRPAAERRQPVGHHAHGRQNDRVDPGVAEHPEQVLPQQRLAACRNIEEMRAEVAVHPKQKEGEADAGTATRLAARSGERAPDQDRQAVDRHARRPRARKRDHEIGRSDGGRNAKEDDAERVEIDIRPGIVGRAHRARN